MFILFTACWMEVRAEKIRIIAIGKGRLRRFPSGGVLSAV